MFLCYSDCLIMTSPENEPSLQTTADSQLMEAVLSRLDHLTNEIQDLRTLVGTKPKARRHSIAQRKLSLSDSLICTKEWIEFLSHALGFDNSSLSDHSTLRYRATSDGWEPSAFHESCDHFTNLLCIVRTIDGFICGGFSGNKDFSGKEHKLAEGSFIFSLTNPYGIDPFILNAAGTESAELITADPQLGPVFGLQDFMVLLESRQLCTSNLGSTFWRYEVREFEEHHIAPNSHSARGLLARPNAEVGEIEVFSIDRL
ncbi:hypothetical protein P9112_002997 [Eukaryota sp. TZLM1-RC]